MSSSGLFSFPMLLILIISQMRHLCFKLCRKFNHYLEKPDKCLRHPIMAKITGMCCTSMLNLQTQPQSGRCAAGCHQHVMETLGARYFPTGGRLFLFLVEKCIPAYGACRKNHHARNRKRHVRHAGECRTYPFLNRRAYRAGIYFGIWGSC